MPISMLEVAKRVDQFFMEQSPVHDTMRRLAAAMRELQIPFAIAGAMAANAYGHKRTTADVDILIRREDLQRFKERFSGLGWVDKFQGSKNFRDATNNIAVDTLLVGDYPGDELPKPVAFPPPETVATTHVDGLPYVSLNTLIELKLASGMTARHRLQDMADVIQLIRANRLPITYGANLNSYVAEAFSQMWQAAQVEDEH